MVLLLKHTEIQYLLTKNLTKNTGRASTKITNAIDSFQTYKLRGDTGRGEGTLKVLPHTASKKR